MKNTLIKWILITVAILILAAVFFIPKSTSPEISPSHKVTRSDMTISVTEGGTLEAVKEVVIKNEIKRESRIVYLIPEGTYVKKGDLLVEFDSSEVDSALQEAKVKLESRNADLIRAENDLIITKSTVESEIRAAEQKLKFAKIDLLKFEELEETHEIQNSSLQIDTETEALKLAEQRYKWSKELAEKGFETKTQVDRDKLEMAKRAKAVATAESSHEILVEFDLNKKYEQKVTDKKEAEANLIRVKKQGESKIAQREAGVNSAKSTLRITKEDVAKKEKQVEAAKLYAPQDGLALYAKPKNHWSNQPKIEEGALIRNRREIIKIPDVSEMKVEVKIHESVIGQIKKDQQAWIVLDALPDKRFKGQVTKVAILPDSNRNWVNPDLKVYSTEITILDDMGDIKPGVSAKAEIIIDELESVLKVPIQAVTTVGGQQVCYLKGEKEPAIVTVGLYNTNFIEIKEGLKEGQKVLLNPPFETDRELTGQNN